MNIMKETKELSREISKIAKKHFNVEKAIIKTSKELPNFMSIEIPGTKSGVVSANFLIYSKRTKDESSVVKLGEVLALMPESYAFQMPEEERALFPEKYDMVVMSHVLLFVKPLCATELKETEDGLTTPLENDENTENAILGCFKSSNTMDDIYHSQKTGDMYLKISDILNEYKLMLNYVNENDGKDIDIKKSMSAKLNYKDSVIEPIFSKLQTLSGKDQKQVKVNIDNDDYTIITLMLTKDTDTTIIGMSFLFDKKENRLYKAMGQINAPQKLEIPDKVVDILPMFGSIQKRA